jgi:hypothetical protein
MHFRRLRRKLVGLLYVGTRFPLIGRAKIFLQHLWCLKWDFAQAVPQIPFKLAEPVPDTMH